MIVPNVNFWFTPMTAIPNFIVPRVPGGRPALQQAAVFGVLEQLGAGGSSVTDAQIAAAALELKGVVHTADSDFLRFPGVRWFNPITGARGGRGLRTV
jgi:hypothetical protein